MRKSTSIIGCVGLAAFLSQSSPSAAQVCPVAFPSVDQSGDLPGFASTTGGGVIFGGGVLELRRETGSFTVGSVDVGSFAFRIAAAADVDGDGWVDIIAGKRAPQSLTVLTNANQTAPPTPTFTLGTTFAFTGVSGSTAIVGGDFNGNGLDDVVRIRAGATNPIVAVDFFGNTGTALPAAPTSAHASPGTLGDLIRSTTSMVAIDWNGDACDDILFGNGTGGTGKISVLVSSCTASPVFVETILLSGLAFADGAASIGYADLDGDGNKDIVASSPGQRKIVMWSSDGAQGFGPAVTITTAFGNAQGLWLYDFSLDGNPDLIWSVDDDPAALLADRGKIFFWKNEGDGTPFDSTSPISLYQDTDMDAGVVFDFDHDPNNTLDLVVGEVSGSTGTYVTLTNGTSAANVLCGTVQSGSLDISSISTLEFAVKSATISPTEASLNLGAGESIDYYMSNTLPENWVLASDCDGGARGPDFCATFPTASGREIRWKAVMCRDPGDINSTPQISNISFTFDYTPGTTQFAAGVVASNGIVYAGAFQEVADRGKLFALDADLTSGGNQLWEASAVIDAQSLRSLYTTEAGVPTNRIDFVSPASGQLTSLLTAGPDTDNVIAWVKGPRFGQSSPTTFGSIVNSTAAVMTPPGLPAHYSFLTTGRGTVDTFVATQSTREVRVFVSGKAGIIHAIRSDPNNPSAVTNGQEAWGFIPDRVAQNYYADYTANEPAGVYVSPTRYMDGAPSLADVWNGTAYVTNLIVGGGDGSTVITSLDVTDADSPIPLWTDVITSGGNVTTKPAVIRVADGTEEGKFMVVAASGLASSPTIPYTRGRRVVGLDLSGSVQWFFDAVCPVTTDITAYETDDGGSFAGAADIDGFIDQVVFADFCGNVYMINVNDPALVSPVSPPFLASALGSIDATDQFGQNSPQNLDTAGNPIKAFFSTMLTTGALGGSEGRPIVGGIAARPDSSTDLILYFGTGGHEEVNPLLQNEFYAVFAKDGSIRSKLAGTCSPNCEKFYGGTVITETQVIFTATVDPVVGGGACDTGSTRLLLASNGVGAGFAFASLFSTALGAAIGAVSSPVFAAANAIYLTTSEGKIVQIGETTMPTAGSNPGQANSTSGVKGDYIATSGWRQLLY